jgi:hypothetical protein
MAIKVAAIICAAGAVSGFARRLFSGKATAETPTA